MRSYYYGVYDDSLSSSLVAVLSTCDKQERDFLCSLPAKDGRYFAPLRFDEVRKISSARKPGYCWYDCSTAASAFYHNGERLLDSFGWKRFAMSNSGVYHDGRYVDFYGRYYTPDII